MSGHFVYPHLPAVGLGFRSPRRPHVTGGLGRAVILVVIDDFITGRLTLKWAASWTGEPIWSMDITGQFWEMQQAGDGWDFTVTTSPYTVELAGFGWVNGYLEQKWEPE